MKRCVLAADHRGFLLKQDFMMLSCLAEQKIEWIDVGAYSSERTDYPLYAHSAIELIIHKKADGAILFCGTGTGMAMVANRYKGIYAAVAWDPHIARAAREDDNCNVLCLPADEMLFPTAVEIVESWFTAEFKGGRYQQRLTLLDV